MDLLVVEDRLGRLVGRHVLRRPDVGHDGVVQGLDQHGAAVEHDVQHRYGQRRADALECPHLTTQRHRAHALLGHDMGVQGQTVHHALHDLQRRWSGHNPAAIRKYPLLVAD